MADAFKRLYQGQPATTSGGVSLYNVPDNYSAIIKDVEIISTEAEGGASDTMTLWILPPGVSATAEQYLWLPATEIGPQESVTWEGSKALEADCSIYGKSATGAILNVIITGMEVDESVPA